MARSKVLLRLLSRLKRPVNEPPWMQQSGAAQLSHGQEQTGQHTTERENACARARARQGLQESMESVALMVAVDVIQKCVSGETNEVQYGWVKART